MSKNFVSRALRRKSQTDHLERRANNDRGAKDTLIAARFIMPYWRPNKIVEASCLPDHILQLADVALIRHAYVRTKQRKKGVGTLLLQELIKDAKKPILIGTWKAADWAIRFYEKHGFRLVEEEEKNRLLKKYWAIPDRQVETSVVLVDEKY